jgi:alkaline phosphatase D
MSRRALLPLLLVAACAGMRAGRTREVRLTHGVAVGETTDTHAVVWARCEAPAVLEVTVDGQAPRRAGVEAKHDLTQRIVLDGLAPGAEHAYRVRCGNGPALSGRFRTAPPPSDAAAVRFAFGGDVGGQNVCRDAARGYPIFAAMAERAPDFFVALGDMVYADGTCLPVGALGNAQVAGPPPASDVESYRAHWRYNRADAASQRLLASTTYYAVWDDHEVRDDFGPPQELYEAGEAAYRDWAPMEDAAPLHRSFRWGRHVELFILDTRSHRDPNAAPDTGPDPKTLLGRRSGHGWKPVSARRRQPGRSSCRACRCRFPPGEARATGGRTAEDRMGSSASSSRSSAPPRALRVRGLVWITTDVHFATGFRYRPFPDAPDFVVHEIASGPLAAGMFPKDDLDRTLRPERLFMHGPRAGQRPISFDAALQWFNFGLVEIDADGRLEATIVDATGRPRHRLTLAAP